MVFVRLDVEVRASFSCVGDLAGAWQPQGCTREVPRLADPLCGTPDGRDHLEGRAEHPVLNVDYNGGVELAEEHGSLPNDASSRIFWLRARHMSRILRLT